jgi:hypothetical protein
MKLLGLQESFSILISEGLFRTKNFAISIGHYIIMLAACAKHKTRLAGELRYGILPFFSQP